MTPVLSGRPAGPILSLLAILAIPWLAAAQPDYFPLQVGNQWVYRGSGARTDSTMTLEITRRSEFNGRIYYLLHGLPEGDFWLRRDENASLVSYDPEQNLEELWYAFQAPEGAAYNTSLPGTCWLAIIASRKAEYRGPIGWFDYALEISYPGFFHPGIRRELLLPYVGLVHRTVDTGDSNFIAYDLIYCRLGGVTHVSEAIVSFGLTLDRSVYIADLEPPVDPRRAVPRMIARLTLRNTTDQPVSVVFPSGQSFDLILRNDAGDVVYRWSDGKYFPQVARTEKFGHGEKNYALLIPLADKAGNPLAPGRYVAEAWLATTPRGLYAASVGFEIHHAF